MAMNSAMTRGPILPFFLLLLTNGGCSSYLDNFVEVFNEISDLEMASAVESFLNSSSGTTESATSRLAKIFTHWHEALEHLQHCSGSCSLITDSLQWMIGYARENPNVWRIMTKGQRILAVSPSKPVPSDFEGVPLLLDSFIFVIVWDRANSEATIYEAYRNHVSEEEGRVVVQKTCKSSAVSGNSLDAGNLCDPNEGLWERRRDLTGVHLRTVFEPWEPYGWFCDGDENNGDKDNLCGTEPEIFKTVHGLLNFSFSHVRSVDGSWGSGSPEVESGGDLAFPGIVGMLQRGELDMTLIGLGILPSTFRVIDTSVSLYETESKMVIKTSGKFDVNFFEIVRIFSRDSWIALLTVCSVLSVAKACDFGLETRRRGPDIDDWSDGVASVMRAVVLKNYPRVTKWIPGKILLVSLMFMGIVVFNYFRGSFLSKLAIEIPSLEVDSLRDVLESDSFSIGTNPKSSQQNFFEFAPEGSVRRLIWERKMKPAYDAVMPKTLREGMDKIGSSDRYAFFTNVDSIRILDGYPCSFQDVAGSESLRVRVGFGFPKNSSLKPLVDSYLTLLRENGAIDRIVQRQLSLPSKTCPKSLELGFESTLGIFMIPVWGLACAFCSFVVESAMMISSSSKRRRKKRNTDEIDLICDKISRQFLLSLDPVKRDLVLQRLGQKSYGQ